MHKKLVQYSTTIHNTKIKEMFACFFIKSFSTNKTFFFARSMIPFSQ